ncbi:MAG: hypothetical protein JF606_27390 [Burkholderiales bacterium]|nr:hypothetical protein [Burkholderiales bacterium]
MLIKSSSKGRIAGQIARDAATAGKEDMKNEVFAELSAAMCWDAVIRCQFRAGVKDPGFVTTAKHDHVISLDDKPVNNKQAMWQVPQGASIGFFRERTLVHLMIATGAGLAAGNKNACIGIGAPVGWEVLNLAQDLNWNGDGFTANGKSYLIRYREVD